MFNLTNELISAKAVENGFVAGQEYFKNNRIKSVQYNQEKRTFTATVLGSRLHTVRLGFDQDGFLNDAGCSCPVDTDRWGICKHMVAVLLLIMEKDNQGFFRELHFRQAAKNIFSFFGDRQISIKSTVTLEPTLILEKASAKNKARLASLRLRMGQDRRYVVKSIKRLLYCRENNTELKFGKGFTYVPASHEFKGNDLLLINMLNEIYETETLMEKLSDNNSDALSVFDNDRVYLTDSLLKRFLDIYTDTPFKADILGKTLDTVTVRKEDIPVNFLLTSEGSDLVLNIDFEGSLIPITNDGEYFYSGSDIYHISKQQSEYLKPFYLAMMYQKGRKLRFIQEDKQRFVSEILPFAEKAGRLTVSEDVQAIIEKVPLQTEIYLDRKGAEIMAEVRFIYGEQTINPFSQQDKVTIPSDKLLIREIHSEELVLDILAMSDFKVREGILHLSGDDNIYDFVFRLVPLLQEHASVYYSENLKNLKLKSSIPFTAHLSLNTDTNMLEFSFDAEGIDSGELIEIMASLAQRKKYYQLKNGSFLNLASKEFSQLGDIIEKMEPSSEMLNKGVIELPRYKAAYLDRNIRDLGLQNIERDSAFKEFVQNITEPQDMTFPIPKTMRRLLRDYQRFGFKWLKTMDYYKLGGVLADDMGLGKTIQMLALLLSSKLENGSAPSLVVVPTSLVYNWCAELDKFTPELKYIVISGSKEERRKLIETISEYDLAITSYPLIRRDVELYSDLNFRYCILDEAQHIKNPFSGNARSVKQIKAEVHFALTGTPMENNLYELWSIFDFVLKGYLYSYNKFTDRYIKAASEEDNREVLSDLSKQIKPFILRRLKKDVLSELPEKIENPMLAELTDDQKKLYLAHLQDIRTEIKKDIEEIGLERSRIRILAALTRLRQICCHPSLFVENYRGGSGKLDLLEEILQESVDSGHRILVFSQFTGMLKIIKKRLDELRIKALYLDGSTPMSERGYLVNSFNEGYGKVFLISLKAGGTGLNLTGADTVIHCDPWWNPAVEEQATDRAYRIGQDKSVYVIKLVTKGTIEEKILALQEKKRELIDAVIQPGETLLSKMTQEELKALFD